jgi:hypothetical protein
MSRRRDTYPEMANLRQRLMRLMNQYANGSIETFSKESRVPVPTLRSYLEGLRAPSAPALYKLWKHMGISATYVLAGVGPELQPAPGDQLAAWSPQVCGGAHSAVYGTNTAVEYEVDGRKGVLSITWTFARERDVTRNVVSRRGRARLLWPSDGGLMAHFSRETFPGGVNWTKHAGLAFRAVAEAPRVTLGVKIKTGASGGAQTELGLRLDVGRQEKELEIVFGDLRGVDPRFDSAHVRTLSFAMTRELVPQRLRHATVHLRDLRFIRKGSRA